MGRKQEAAELYSILIAMYHDAQGSSDRRLYDYERKLNRASSLAWSLKWDAEHE